MIQNYRDLKVWQKAMDLTERIFVLSEKFPKQQAYVMTSQIQRSALSVPSNVAEGRSRHSENDFIYHLNIARGSLAELETQILLSMRLKYLSETEGNELLLVTSEITRMLHGLKTSLKDKAKTYNLKPVT